MGYRSLVTQEGIYFDPLPAHVRPVSLEEGSLTLPSFATPSDEFRFHPLQPHPGRAHRRLLPPSSARSRRIVFLETHATGYLSSAKRRSSMVTTPRLSSANFWRAPKTVNGTNSRSIGFVAKWSPVGRCPGPRIEITRSEFVSTRATHQRPASLNN